MQDCCFTRCFANLIDIFYGSVLPGIGSPLLGNTLKFTAAAALILPQSILLGMTFPVMSGGILRRFPETPGSSIAMLYFTNSIGAAIGVLASGFWLIGKVGLPGNDWGRRCNQYPAGAGCFRPVCVWTPEHRIRRH